MKRGSTSHPKLSEKVSPWHLQPTKSPSNLPSQFSPGSSHSHFCQTSVFGGHLGYQLRVSFCRPCVHALFNTFFSIIFSYVFMFFIKMCFWLECGAWLRRLFSWNRLANAFSGSPKAPKRLHFGGQNLPVPSPVALKKQYELPSEREWLLLGVNFVCNLCLHLCFSCSTHRF